MGHTWEHCNQLGLTAISFTAQMAAMLARLREQGTARIFTDQMDHMLGKLPTALGTTLVNERLALTKALVVV